MKVKEMVCPDCARMNGQEHVEGCPSGFPPGTWLGDYIEGWDVAKNALLPPLFEEIMRLRELVQAHHAAGALDGVLVGDKCPVCGGSE